MIFAIDPGTTESAFVRCSFKWKSDNPIDIQAMEILPNEQLVKRLHHLNEHDDVAIEMVASYGMPVGKDVFETCVWIGRFVEAAATQVNRYPTKMVYRKQVKVELCGSLKAKDANIRQALLDIFPQTGGGKTPQIGTKKKPGPLYGMKSHLWSALAVAITFDRTTNGS